MGKKRKMSDLGKSLGNFSDDHLQNYKSAMLEEIKKSKCSNCNETGTLEIQTDTLKCSNCGKEFPI
ncbi:hypothetical protein [Salinicoccus roseus]|uniref:hypothetical protein n=1 Tax=Salinicoccus roseus TaxID=45670 RepID=UPI0035699B3C